GLAATRAIRQRPALKGLPVIAMTAGAMESERAQTREAGMDEHVTKPVDIDALINALLRALGTDAPVADSAPAASAIDSPDAAPLLDASTALRAL
ncbi:response regulator, partial [Klebsiella pneumoniae]